MRAFRLPLRFLALWFVIAIPANVWPCSLCSGGAGKRPLTLSQELERSPVLVYGTLSNARLEGDSGTTDLRVARMLGKNAGVPAPTVVTLQGYIPILDSKNPPRFLIFCELVEGKLTPRSGREVRSPALLDYLKHLENQRPKNRIEALCFFGKFLDHGDDAVATDGFLEFMRSTDAEVAEAARKLAPAPLRRVLRNPRASPERLSLAAVLLGACGDDGDARLLRSRIDQAGQEEVRALDGLLSGYLQLCPNEGWSLVFAILGDPKRDFAHRYAALRSVRFCHGSMPSGSKANVLRAMRILIHDGLMADIACDDLRQWKMWDLTDEVLVTAGKASHQAAIVQRAIVRYALSCPLPEARCFVDQARRHNAELVRDIEDSLQFER
jgi:hypothetical protein